MAEGTRAFACAAAAFAFGGYALLETLLSKRSKAYSILAVLGMAMAVAVFISGVQGGG